MGIKKKLVHKTYLSAMDETVPAIRLGYTSIGESKTHVGIVTEPGDVVYYDDMPLKINMDREYLVGEIADRLYEYEQLGYEPDELRLMIMELKARKQTTNSIYGKNGLDVASLYPKQIYVTTGRCNGKTELQRRMYEYLLYTDHDIVTTDMLVNTKKQFGEWLKNNPYLSRPEISNVIFNDPATIVFWADGTKTVVKAQDEAFDPEKGLAMAICKKIFGNEGNYFNQIKKWTEKYEEPKKLDAKAIKAIGEQIVKGFLDGIADGELPWKIWVEYYDNGELYASAVLPKEYKCKSSAVRAARRQYDYHPNVKWTVSQTNPWIKEKENG